MPTHLSSTTGFRILAHSGLKALFESPRAPLSGLQPALHFVEEADLSTSGDPGLPVLLPVTSEFQAERLRTVRLRHSLALLVAVTNDVSGHQTYYAIRSGANFVLNLAIPEERQIDALLAQFRAHCPRSFLDRAEARLRAVPDGSRLAAAAARAGAPAAGSRPGDTAPAPSRPATSGIDTELLRLLCTSATVSEIARRYYCSERSMYRRIRRLYDALGVSGRAELLPLAVSSGLVDSASAQAG